MSKQEKKTQQEEKEQKEQKEQVKDQKANQEDEKQGKEEEKKDKQEEKFPEVKPGRVVRIYEKVKEIDLKGNPKERIQVFEGMVLARKGGSQPGATITVRKIAANGVGVEKIYPIHSPVISKIEVVRKYKVRRAKLYYLRDYKKKLKEIKA